VSASPARLVVFDLGGVLVRTRGSWEEACDAAGVARQAGVDAWGGWARYARALDTGEITDDDFFEAVARESRGAYSPDQIRRVHAVWIDGEYDGVPALFDALDAKGAVETGILSNTSAAHWERMGAPPYAAVRRARHPHASHLLRAAKPSPLAFSRFEAAAGQRGASILFFDDRKENVEAARAAGWNAVHVPFSADPARFVHRRLAAEGLARLP
jgi:putative hydrolase of the HAD superfamily